MTDLDKRLIMSVYGCGRVVSTNSMAMVRYSLLLQAMDVGIVFVIAVNAAIIGIAIDTPQHSRIWEVVEIVARPQDCKGVWRSVTFELNLQKAHSSAGSSRNCLRAFNDVPGLFFNLLARVHSEECMVGSP